MKNNILSFTLFWLISISISYTVKAMEHDEHHGNTFTSMTLDQGNKWPIDDSLHIGMTEIKKLMTTNLADIHQNKFTDQQYSTLANAIQDQLNYLFVNCALPSSADAQLHILLSGVMQGVSQMNTNNEKQKGIILVMQALKNYFVYFNDPHWDDVSH